MTYVARKVAVDLDGVVIDLVSMMLPKLGELTGRSVTAEDIRVYEIGEALGLSETMMQGVWDWLTLTRAYDKAPAIGGAVDALLKLGPDRVSFLTTRSEKLRETTSGWLKRHGLTGYDLEMGVEHGRRERAQDFHAVVDDNPKSIQDAGPHVKVLFLYDQPWNRSAALRPNVVRVTNWQQILDWLAEADVIGNGST